MAYYQTKQAGRLVALSVRTLQYYDEIGLVAPSKRSDNGYRLYSDKEISELQLISTLKYCGYSLKQIKLLIRDNQVNLIGALSLQTQLIEDKINDLKRAKKLTAEIQQQLARQQTVDWQTLSNITQMLQKPHNSNMKQDLTLLLSNDELKQLEKTQQKNSQSNPTPFGQQWHTLYQKVEQHLDLAPDHNQSQALLDEWMTLVEQTYGSNPQLQYKVWQALKIGALSTNQNNPHEQAIFDFIAKAQAARDSNDT